MSQGLLALLLGILHACIHDCRRGKGQQSAGVYLDREADIVGQLLSGAAGVLEALDVQQQHLWQAVDAQPLCGLSLLTTLLALEALITLSSNLHSLCPLLLHLLYVMNNLYVLQAWDVLEVLHGLCVFCISSRQLLGIFLNFQTNCVRCASCRTCSLSSNHQDRRTHLSQGTHRTCRHTAPGATHITITG